MTRDELRTQLRLLVNEAIKSHMPAEDAWCEFKLIAVWIEASMMQAWMRPADSPRDVPVEEER